MPWTNRTSGLLHFTSRTRMISIARIVLISTLICLTIIGNSCGSKEHVVSHSLIQKRKYTKGHHFNFRSSVNKSKAFAHATKLKLDEDNKSPSSTNSLSLPLADLPSTEVQEGENSSLNWLVPNEQADSTNNGCGTIQLLNGKKISVKILEVSPDEVKYRRCSMQDGPDFILKKNVIDRIIYANGEEDVMNDIPYVRSNETAEEISPEYSSPLPVNEEEQITEGLSLASMIVGIFALLTFPFLVVGITSLILSISGMSKIKGNPKKWKGKEFATVGLILGIISLVLAFFYWGFVLIFLTGL